MKKRKVKCWYVQPVEGLPYVASSFGNAWQLTAFTTRREANQWRADAAFETNPPVRATLVIEE